ncbi:MAG: SDR family oxidoreductase [Sterolibacterium sp.]|nr:SDR family oxidoreductase [Sterolibacterium sp.]
MGIRDLFDLSGQVALVSGASRGLGLQMAEALGGMGARLAIVARKADELHAAAARLAAQGCEVLPVVADLGDGEATVIPGVVDTVLAHYGQIDILLNNAGTSWGAAAEDYPDAAWRKVMNLNVDALFFLTREVGRRAMLPRRSGKIINIASIAGLGGNPAEIQTIAYNTSKGAVVNFTRALAAEWGPQGINVNAICPGFFPTKMSRGLLAAIEPQVVAATPLRRLGSDEDLQGTVVYLASAASRHVTGQCLTVDGGMSVVIGA